MIDHRITVENLMRVFPMAFVEDDRLQALGKAIAEELVRRRAEAKLGILYANIDELPEDVLDILAYDFKVDWWDRSYTLEEKRRTLKDSWKVHRMMGTKAAVEMAISAIYPSTTVEEWFTYDGKPYHFKLTIDARYTRTDIAQHEKVLNRVNYYKNLRSHLECIEYVTRFDPMALHIGGGATSIMCTPIQEAVDRFDFERAVRGGGQAASHSSTPISEQPDNFRFADKSRIGGQGGIFTTSPLLQS